MSKVDEARVSEHLKMAVASADAKSKVGVLTEVGFGGVPVMLAAGATVSIVSGCGVTGPTLPA